MNSDAGKIEALETLLKDFLKGDHEAVIEKAKKAIKKETRYIITQPSPLASYYVKAMEKMDKNSGYAEKEIARLNKILKGGQTTAKKQDEMVIKTNILKGFVQDEGHDEL